MQIASQSAPILTCRVCTQGSLEKKRISRMSTPVVIIGYIILTPSVIGIIISALMLFGVISAASNSTDSASQAGAGIAAGMVIFFGIGCFVAGLLGWLLVMKKRVLQCSTCGAVVNAS